MKNFWLCVIVFLLVVMALTFGYLIGYNLGWHDSYDHVILQLELQGVK